MKSLMWILAVAVAAVLTLSAKASYAQECMKCEGKVKAVNCDAKTITCTVKEGEAEKEMTCKVADDAKVTLNGAEAKLADLKEGDAVACEYVKQGEDMVAKVVAAKRE